jgi:hypothetical protein
MKPPLRTKSVGTKVSEAEFALLEERARGAGLRLAEWVREALLAAPVESGPDAAEVALAEVLALRSLLLNLHFRAAKGEPVAESEMRGLIERADGVKMQRARERLVAVRAESKTDEEPEPACAVRRADVHQRCEDAGRRAEPRRVASISDPECSDAADDAAAGYGAEDRAAVCTSDGNIAWPGSAKSALLGPAKIRGHPLGCPDGSE